MNLLTERQFSTLNLMFPSIRNPILTLHATITNVSRYLKAAQKPLRRQMKFIKTGIKQRRSRRKTQPTTQLRIKPSTL